MFPLSLGEGFLTLGLSKRGTAGAMGLASTGLVPWRSHPAPDAKIQAWVLRELGQQGLESHFWQQPRA